MAMPIWAALSAGASLTPSPVMATISPLALSARTSRSFCSGRTRAKMLVAGDAPAASASSSPSISGAGDWIPPGRRPTWRAMFWAVTGSRR